MLPLGASAMDKFMSGLADMMGGRPEDAGADEGVALGLGSDQDVDDFRSSLIKQSRCS